MTVVATVGAHLIKRIKPKTGRDCYLIQAPLGFESRPFATLKAARRAARFWDRQYQGRREGSPS